MAFSRSTLAALLVLFSLLVLHLNEAQQFAAPVEAPSPLPHLIDCGAACAGRCKLTKRPNLCKRACGSCCARCGCVPPGTSGNLEACPCYANLKTHNNTRKCP